MLNYFFAATDIHSTNTVGLFRSLLHKEIWWKKKQMDEKQMEPKRYTESEQKIWW